MVINLLLGGLLLALVAVVFYLLWFTARKLQVKEAACPKCVHKVRGLVDPRCPECGTDLGAGVLAPRGIRPRPRRWLGFGALLVSLPAAGLAVLIMSMLWSSFLQAVGLIYMQTEFTRTVTVQVDSSHQMTVESSSDFVERAGSTATGEVKVVLDSSGVPLASWKGTGPVLGPPVNGVRIDGGLVIDSLQSQIHPDHESPFATILNDPLDSELLGKVIVSYAAPTKGVSEYVIDFSGKKMFEGGVANSSEGRSGLVLPDPIWFLPMYVVPLVFLLAFLLLGLRILFRRRTLEPFEPACPVN